MLLAVKDKAFSTTGAVAAVGLWCCGTTYWCVKLQQKQARLEKQLAHERSKRSDLKTALADLGERAGTQYEAVLVVGGRLTQLQREIGDRLEPIEKAIYGTTIGGVGKTTRLSLLAKLLNDAASRVDPGSLVPVDPTASQSSIVQNEDDSVPSSPGNLSTPGSPLMDSSPLVPIAGQKPLCSGRIEGGDEKPNNDENGGDNANSSEKSKNKSGCCIM